MAINVALQHCETIALRKVGEVLVVAIEPVFVAVFTSDRRGNSGKTDQTFPIEHDETIKKIVK